jgi:NTE family protein
LAAEQATVGLVLAGGGARGAYEVGVLSALLPVLEARGERPRIVLGTSVGAVNAAFLAANADRSATDLIPDALAIWKSIRWAEVARPLISPGSLLRFTDYAGEVLGVPGTRLESLLDPAPLRATLGERIDFARIAANVESGALRTAAVAATSAATGGSVVFHDGGASPPPDTRRRIDYVEAPLSEEKVLASAAIPAIFPAVHVDEPVSARGWYLDGGTRLNTPIKPALEFGAERVIVIGLAPVAAAVGGPAQSPGEGPTQSPGEGPTRSSSVGPTDSSGASRVQSTGAAAARSSGATQPDALAAAGQILLGLLEDQLAADLQTLATINTLTRATRLVPGRKRRVPYIAIAPAEPDAIGKLALRVVRKHYSGPIQAVRSPDVALLARLVAGGLDVAHAEPVSFLLFAPEFTTALIELGRQDAQRWIDTEHDVDDLWQLRPLG